jgi:hypothetical protein
MPPCPTGSTSRYRPPTNSPTVPVTPLILTTHRPGKADNEQTTLCAPTTTSDQTLHPYFDDIENHHWLEDNPAVVIFAAEPPPDRDPTLAARTRGYFATFGLETLYAAQAAQEICNIGYELSRVLEEEGPEGVGRHLNRQAETRRHHAINSWQSALYTALASSDWFCDGGWDDGPGATECETEPSP